MFKPLVVTTRPSELKIRKYHLKYLHGLTLPFKPSSEPKTSHVKFIKKAKSFFHSKLRYESKSTVVLSIIKHFDRSLVDIPAPFIPKYAKELTGLKYYQFDTRTFSAWRNLLYIAKTLKVLTVYTNPLRDLPRTKVPKKNGSQLAHVDRDKDKMHLLSRCMDRFTNLEHISFFMRLDEEHYRLLCLFENFSDHLKNLKDIDLTIISFIGKLGLSSRNFPNLLGHVKFFKLYAQDNVNQIDEILTNFHLFGKLNSLSIACDSCKQGSWTMFRCIDKLKSLQKLELWLTQPSFEVCCALLEHISLPESLVSFTFGVSSMNANLSQQLFEDNNWEDYSIFECPRRFKRFITAIHSCRKLQELRIEFDKTNFVKDFNNLFINLCETLGGIKHLSIHIKEPEERDPEEFNEEGAFRLDLVLQSNPMLLRNIKSFELAVPTFSMRNLPENLSLNELIYLKLSGRLFETTDNDRLALFLSKIQPKEDFKIMLSELEVDDEDTCRRILESIIAIPKLRSYVYMFETILDKTIILAVVKEFVSAETAALIKFPTTNDVSFAYKKKFKEFLRINGKEGGMQNHEDGVIIRWKPIGAI